VIDVYDNLAMGLGEIADVHALADLLGWDSTRLTGSQGSMQRDGALLVRRLLTREIAMALARSHPTRVQALVDDARRERRRRVRARMELLMEHRYMSAEAALDEANKHFRETGDEPHNHLARWIGYDESAIAEDRRDLELRYSELRRLARQAIPELHSRRTLKATALAEAIARVLK
jgi:pimeloyl-ACP methyl ester carboxylesterase